MKYGCNNNSKKEREEQSKFHRCTDQESDIALKDPRSPFMLHYCQFRTMKTGKLKKTLESAQIQPPRNPIELFDYS